MYAGNHTSTTFMIVRVRGNIAIGLRCMCGVFAYVQVSSTSRTYLYFHVVKGPLRFQQQKENLSL